jgi:plastocyanin
LNPAEAGNLTYNSSNSSVAMAIGGILIPIGEGQANITVSFAGNDKYAAAENKTITVNVSLNDATVSVDNDTLDLFVGDTCAINATTVPPIEKLLNITYTSSDESVAIVDENGTVTAVGEGTAIITVEVGDDVVFAKNSTTVTVTVSKIPTEILIQNDTLDMGVGDVVDPVVSLIPSDAGNLSFKVSDDSVVLVNGSGVVTAVGEGNATILVSFPGNDKYLPSNATIAVTVKEIVIIEAPDVEKYYGGSERFVVTVTDSKDTPLVNKTVKIKINGKEYVRVTDENGTASMALGLPSNTYNVTVTVDNTTVNAAVTVLSTVNGTDVVKMYRNATQYYATFRDSEGNFLADGTVVNFNINGVFYERKVSGGKGQAKLNINLPAGEYVITAINPETGENEANNITVLATIVENKDITKFYKNGTQYTVKVLGADGKAVGEGENVTFNINGVFYTRQTDASGIATLNINLPPKTYTVTAEYNGFRTSNTINVLSVLETHDLNMKYKDGSKFEAKVLDGQGKPYAGQSVTFNINGVFYPKTTGEDGIARLTINLPAGEYIITSTYNGLNAANKVTISG